MDRLHVQILRDLVSFRTITPRGLDAIKYCSNFLSDLGFRCQILEYGDVSNLYARLGSCEKNICFAGHVDVVPPSGNWKTDPFALCEKDGVFYGRGVNDMKGPLSSALAAIRDFVSLANKNISISVMLTSDEEVMCGDGCEKVVEFLKAKKETITGAVLCESCSPRGAGEYIKTGCKGSLNVEITSLGKQCHVVNGRSFGNHIHSFIGVLNELVNLHLDDGNENFTPSDLEITSIDVGNETRNLIPSSATAKLNIRFNELWTFEKLENLISEIAGDNKILFQRFGHPIICKNHEFIDFLKNAIYDATGQIPEVGTVGGNSDAFSIESITDVVEIGSSTSEAHIENEFISDKDLIKLRNIYLSVLNNFSSADLQQKM
jgi:succinyl-diaminopimelate desuccinylase